MFRQLTCPTKWSKRIKEKKKKEQKIEKSNIIYDTLDFSTSLIGFVST